jgi:hypothetical protein
LIIKENLEAQEQLREKENSKRDLSNQPYILTRNKKYNHKSSNLIDEEAEAGTYTR